MSFISDLGIVVVAVPATITTTTTTAALDVSALDASVGSRNIRFVWNIGTVAGTTPSIAMSVQECSTTNGTYADPPRLGTVAARTTDGYSYLDALITKQYVKVTTAFTSNTTSAIVGILALGDKRVNSGV